jgi:hypothetical protein
VTIEQSPRPHPEYAPSMRICPAVVDGYYALLRQRADLAAAGELSPLMANHYADVTGDLLVMGIKAAASDAVCTLALTPPETRPTPLILQPWGGWTNFPTWAAHAWLSRDATTAAAAEEIVSGAPDAAAAGEHLGVYMAQHTGAATTQGGAPDLLAAGLEIAVWEEIAWSFATGDEWEQLLDEHGNYRCTTWDEDEPEGGERP